MTPPLTSQPPDDRYCALGQVVEMAAVMEISLRMAFCVLIGGGHVAVVAGGQETHWLIENCDALARHHQELQEDRRQQIHAALRLCQEANHERNRLVHEAWGADAGGSSAQADSRRRSYPITGHSWSAAEIQAAASAIGTAQQALIAAIENAFGPGSLQQAEQLLIEDAAERRR